MEKGQLKMKDLKSMKKVLILILIIFFINFIKWNIYAAGEGNVDGGGSGNMGEGTHNNQWIPGDEGVRVTLVDAKTGSTECEPIDLARKSHRGKSIYHFEKECKLTYLCGKELLPAASDKDYLEVILNNPIPVIISSNTYGKSNPQEIKSYFTDNGTLFYIAENIGITFEELTSGKYKLVLEPVIYFTYDGKYYAMTAHEFALYDNLTAGKMRAKFKTTAYKNLAYSMFLEYAELGIGAWTKGTEDVASISDMLNYLGIGIIHFNGNGIIEEFPDIPEQDTENNDISSSSRNQLQISTEPYTYRIDTDVITSIKLHTDIDITPANPISVTFYINGNAYQISDIVIPAGGSQLVWCKWHTPDTAQNITAYAKVTGKKTISIPITIEELKENEPPDPKATDMRGTWKTVKDSDLPLQYETDKLSWTKWYTVARLVEYTVTHTYINEEGEEVTETKTKTKIEYDYYKNHYSAVLTVDFILTADTYCPTASADKKTIGSGYGVNALVKCRTTVSENSNAVTGCQNAVFYFPEFTYQVYWRLGELTKKGLNSVLEFKNNKYSPFFSRTHFTPIWYPDGNKNYKVYVRVVDAWTPAGMLQVSKTDAVSITRTVLDDWHIGEVLE